jgi:hypothetical protein
MLPGPATYSYYRIEITGNGGLASTSLAEIELLSKEKPSPLSAQIKAPVAGAGDTASVGVVVSNSGDAPASGQVTLTGPQGWTVSPVAAAFGPVASGASQTVTFNVVVPAGTAPGDYPVQAVVTSKVGTAAAMGAIHVAGDVIAFTPFTSAEEPWLFEADGSQSDGRVFEGTPNEGNARFADGNNHFTYRFDLPADVTGGKLTLDIGNQFLVQVSPDNQSWRTVLLADVPPGDTGLRNRAERELDLNDLRGQSSTLYLRIADSHTEDGWGGWLARLTLELQR